MDLEKLPDFGEGFKTYGPPRGRVHDFLPHSSELLVAHLKKVESCESEAAERDRLICFAVAKVHPEEVEDVEEGFPVRLALERLGDHGVEEVLGALYADLDVTRFLSNGETWDRGRAWRHMAFAVGHWQLQGAGVWAVEEKASGEFAGMIGFWEPATWPGFELSGHLARRFWGQGYASEGALAALAFAFNVLGKERIISLGRWPRLRSRPGAPDERNARHRRKRHGGNLAYLG